MKEMILEDGMAANSRAKPSTKLLLTLGVPSFGLTFAVTMLSAYVPSLLNSLTNPIVIGLIIGAEGFFGLFMPVIMGNLADRSKKVSGRFTYLVPATALMAAALCLIGLFHLVLLIGLMVAAFYIGYYSYLAPYWAIYPDLIPKNYSGRARSAESVWRVAGALIALISGGFLISAWRPLPFILAAVLLAGVTFWLAVFLRKRKDMRISRNDQDLHGSISFIWHTLKRNPGIRNLVIANALWNATLRSILTFTVLFFTVGLGKSHHFVSGVIFPIAAIGMIAMAPLSGKLADEYGHLKVLTMALVVYGIGTLAPGIWQKEWLFFFVPLVSGAAATVMTLPYSVLMRLLDGEPHGAASGLFGVSRGVGSFLGPLLTGVGVAIGKPFFPGTHGFAVFWLIAGAYILVSLVFVRKISLAAQPQPA